eukprot:16107-Heterococcus_DN1.PRE.1
MYGSTEQNGLLSDSRRTSELFGHKHFCVESWREAAGFVAYSTHEHTAVLLDAVLQVTTYRASLHYYSSRLLLTPTPAAHAQAEHAQMHNLIMCAGSALASAAVCFIQDTNIDTVHYATIVQNDSDSIPQRDCVVAASASG